MRKKFKPPHTKQSKDISHMSVCASLITRYRVMTNEIVPLTVILVTRNGLGGRLKV
jgi:hypothetical protein